jgi:ubiquinone/menaquinone biosynthesis C-methylase UbiE
VEVTESNYNKWHSVHASEEDINSSWHNYVKVNLLPSDSKNKSILEIGCGRGGFSDYLARLQATPMSIFACDYSEAALEIARGKYLHNTISWQKEDIMNMTFPADYFDTAISCETIEHVPNPAKAIAELYRVLKPGGKLILTCPSYFNLFGIWCIYRWLIGKPFTEGGQPYVNYILMPQVYFWIRNAGFKVEEFKSCEVVIPARIPKHFYNASAPWLLKPFGFRTFYVLKK